MGRILLVDDDADVLASLALLLESSYDVACARDGAQALEALEVGGFDAVVLDLMMPVMDGAELLRELRRRGLRVPVLIASAGSHTGRQARELGADDWLQKPFDVELLERKLARLVVA